MHDAAWRGILQVVSQGPENLNITWIQNKFQNENNLYYPNIYENVYIDESMLKRNYSPTSEKKKDVATGQL